MSSITSNIYFDKIKLLTNGIAALDGGFCQLNYQKIKKAIFPQSSDPPRAKKDENGNLLTSKSCLQNLYMKTYRERLRPALIRSQYIYEDIFSLKKELFNSRLTHLKTIKSNPWTIQNLEDAIKRLKLNKC